MARPDGVAPLAALVEERFHEYADARRPYEDRWMEAHYNVMGEHQGSDRGSGSMDQFRSVAEGRARAGSRPEPSIFVRMTRQKVRTAHQILAGAFSGNRVPFELTNETGGHAGLEEIEKEITRVHLLDRRQEKMRTALWDSAEYGTAVIRTDVVRRIRTATWVPTPSGRPARAVITDDIPGVEVLPCWYFYPDPDAETLGEAEAVIQYHRLYAHQLRQAVRDFGWDKAAVSRVLENKTGSDDAQWWEGTLRGARRESGDNPSASRRHTVLEFWGWVDRDEFMKAARRFKVEGLDELPEDLDPVPARIVVCRGEILFLGLNPWDPVRYPYLVHQWEPVPHNIWGVGIAENVRDAQKLVNGAVRLFLLNKALSGLAMLELDVDKLDPEQDLLSVYAGKVWLRRPRAEPGEAVRPVTIPDVSKYLIDLKLMADSSADDAAGIPKYAAGLEAPHLNRTATGVSILWGAANQGLREVAQRFDDQIIEPMVERDYDWLMEFGQLTNPVPTRIRATGVGSAQARELRARRVLEFLQIISQVAQGPMGIEVAAEVDFRKLLREIVDALELEEITRDERQAAAIRAALARAQQQPGGQGVPGPDGGQTGGPPRAPDISSELGEIFGAARGIPGAPRVGG